MFIKVFQLLVKSFWYFCLIMISGWYLNCKHLMMVCSAIQGHLNGISKNFDTSFSGKIINVFPPSQVLHHCHNLINAQQIAKRGCFDGEIAIYKFIKFSQNHHLIEPWQKTSIQVFTIQIYIILQAVYAFFSLKNWCPPQTVQTASLLMVKRKIF